MSEGGRSKDFAIAMESWKAEVSRETRRLSCRRIQFPAVRRCREDERGPLGRESQEINFQRELMDKTLSVSRNFFSVFFYL